MAEPLEDILVIDLSRVLAGPWATQLLADYGARVIKVERPGAGDDTRGWGPPWFDSPEQRVAAYFLAANRNKESVTIDLASTAGQELLRALIRRADVLVENFRTGTMARFGLDADSLQALNPGLIYCSISAFGRSGPRAEEAGYDAMIQAEGGLMSITGDEAPTKCGVAVADLMAGMYAATAILAALHERTRTGKGRNIDVPLFDTQVAWLANQAMNYLVSGEVPARHGNAHPNIVPYQSFATADGHLVLAVGNDGQFARCVACLGLPELAQDERFSSNAARVRHREPLVAALGARLARRTTDEWLDQLRAAGVPCGPVNDLAAVFDGLQQNGHPLMQEVATGEGGSLRLPGSPVRFDGKSSRVRSAPPALGADTDAVLSELLDCDETGLARLREQGAI